MNYLFADYNFTRILAYLNPGTGSIIAQLIAAFILGGGILIRIFWSRIKTLFSGKKNDLSETDEDDSSNG